MATIALPPPPSNAGKKWQSAYKAYQANPTDPAAYAAYYAFLQSGPVGSQLLQSGNYPAPGSTGSPGTSGGGQTPGGVPVTIPGTPLTVPAAGPGVPIINPGTPAGLTTRFGGAPLQSYQVGVGYGLPSPATPGASLPATTPAPPAGGTPAPAGGPPPAPAPGGVPAAGGGVSTPGAGGAPSSPGPNPGNAGGAQQAQGGNAAGGEMHLVRGPDGKAQIVSASETNNPGYIDLGPVGAGLLSAAATAAPGWAGLGLGALQAAGRLYNTAVTDNVRSQQGLPALDFGQWLGSALGANNYGSLSGDATIANPDQYGGLQRQIDAKQLGSDPFSSLFKTNALGSPTAETYNGDPYASGPGGILGMIGGWLGLNDTSPAASYQTTQDQLSGQEAVKMLAEETGLPTAQAQALLDQDKPGGSAIPAGYVPYNGPLSAQPGGTIKINGQTYAPGGGANGNGGNIGSVSGSDHAGGFSSSGTQTGNAGVASSSGGGWNSVSHYAKGGYVGAVPMMTGIEGGWPLLTDPGSLKVNISGSGHPRYWTGQPGTGAPPKKRKMTIAQQAQGGGLSESDKLNMAELARIQQRRAALAQQQAPTPGAVPVAPQATQAFPDQQAGGGDLYARGGRVRGRPDRVMDNRTIHANEGEFVIRNSAAAAAGPRLLQMMNTPQGAAHIRRMLGW